MTNPISSKFKRRLPPPPPKPKPEPATKPQAKVQPKAQPKAQPKTQPKAPPPGLSDDSSFTPAPPRRAAPDASRAQPTPSLPTATDISADRLHQMVVNAQLGASNALPATPAPQKTS